jgi:hypothetical protein
VTGIRPDDVHVVPSTLGKKVRHLLIAPISGADPLD